MTEVSAVNSALSNFSIDKRTSTEPKSNELGQDAFLELLITQMENQDPLSPAENTEFIAQLAQFTSVESLDKLNTNFASFATNFNSNQALQASSLVGTQVSVDSRETLLPASGMVSGTVDVPASTSNLAVNIYNDAGSLVDTIPVGEAQAGELVFRWDGMNAEVNGEMLEWQSQKEGGQAAGMYSFKVMSKVDGDPTELGLSLSANVNSVTVGKGGDLTLNLAGLGAYSINDVKQFN